MRLLGRVAALFHHDKPAAPVASALVVNTKEDGKKHELVLERWTLACFGNDLLPARQNLSIVFAPLPTLALYSLLYLTLAEKARKRMRKICAVSEKSITSLGPLVSSLVSSLDPPSSLFVRVFVDRAQLGTVHDAWTDTAQSIFGNKVVISVERDKLVDYIRSHSNEIIANPIIPTAKGLVGMASACVVAEWFGKTGPFPRRPFALTYRESQMHDYFVLVGPCRRLAVHAYTAWWIDLRTGEDSSQDQMALVLLRPYARGGILRLRDELRPRQLHELLQDLRSERSRESRLLLPALQLHSQAEMLNKWRLAGVESTALRSGPRSTRPIAPPFVSAVHAATLRIDEMGVDCTLQDDDKSKPHTRLPHSYSPLEASLDRAVDPNFHFRGDSPFLLLLVHVPTLVPIIAGCYAGAPATSSLMLRRSLSQSQSSVRVSQSGKEKGKQSRVTRVLKSITDKIDRLKKRTKEKLERRKRRKQRKKNQKSRIDGEATRSTTTTEDSSVSTEKEPKWREKLRAMSTDDTTSSRKSIASRRSSRKKASACVQKKPASPSREFFA